MEKFKINDVTYTYNYDKMSAEQILLCQSAWEVSEAIKKVLPQSDDELLKIMDKRVNAKGYELLLMIENKEGFIRSTRDKNVAVGVLENMLGADFKRLEVCKNDFFTQQGIISENLINVTKSLLGSGEMLKLLSAQANVEIN